MKSSINTFQPHPIHTPVPTAIAAIVLAICVLSVIALAAASRGNFDPRSKASYVTTPKPLDCRGLSSVMSTKFRNRCTDLDEDNDIVPFVKKYDYNAGQENGRRDNMMIMNTKTGKKSYAPSSGCLRCLRCVDPEGKTLEETCASAF